MEETTYQHTSAYELHAWAEGQQKMTIAVIADGKHITEPEELTEEHLAN